MRIVVHGIPGPQGSKKFMGLRKNGLRAGSAILAESSKKVKPWRAAVKAEAQDQIRLWPSGWVPLGGPVLLVVVFTLPAPKSLPKRSASYPIRMPDLSKLVRSTEDALTDAGVWEDDARVVECRSIKTYPAGIMGAHPSALDSPGALILVSPYVSTG